MLWRMGISQPTWPVHGCAACVGEVMCVTAHQKHASTSVSKTDVGMRFAPLHALWLLVDCYGRSQMRCFFILMCVCLWVWLNGMYRAAPTTTNRPLKTFTCSTSNTSCTAGIYGSSVRFTFCIIITAHTRSGNISSAPRCQPGRAEGETVELPPLVPSLLVSCFFLTLPCFCFSVMLPPVSLNSVKPVAGTPQCLNLIWSRTLSVFPISTSEIRAGNLISQIEFTAQGQVWHSQICPNIKLHSHVK